VRGVPKEGPVVIAVQVRCRPFTPLCASDILLNVFLAIAVDNLADADSLNTPADKKWV
jgi:hypothetical protein